MTIFTRLALITSAIMVFPASAMSQSATEIDANGDGVLTVDEVQAVYPQMTLDSFSTMDLNADGALDDGEVQSAKEAGLMPANNG